MTIHGICPKCKEYAFDDEWQKCLNCELDINTPKPEIVNISNEIIEQLPDTTNILQFPYKKEINNEITKPISNKYFLGWESYLTKIIELSDKIKKSNIPFFGIYGIPRGGLIPATIISHRLNIKYVEKLDIILSDEINKFLCIDDISDTGKTLKEVTKTRDNIMTATIYKHKNTEFIPDFWLIENEKWIVFPYEKRNE